MKVIILAGGGGTRLWPVSRKNKPKQIQPFIGNKTLLQKTYERVRRGFGTNDIFVSTNYAQLALIQKQLPAIPRDQYILETAKKDTAAAIGLAAISLSARNQHEVMMLVSSDHYIKNEKEFIRICRLSERLIAQHPTYSLLLGIRPTYPETGYGYIKINKLFQQLKDDEIFNVEKFVEKPDLPTAQKYVKRWDYLWNSGIFCWRVDHLLDLFRKLLPDQYRILMRIRPFIGTASEKKVVTREYQKIKPISIDYGIMEKTKKRIVIPADIEWADVGHWRTVKDILAKTTDENVVRGRHVAHDSAGNLVYSYSGRLIATAGLRNMIVIDTADCVLVCPKDRAQDVKKIVEHLEKNKMKKYL